MIIRTILVAAAALASISFGPGHAKAAAPYCAVISLGPGNAYWDCQYFLGGNRGFCNPSPYYVAGPAQQTRKRARLY
jgi:hypothetical protein